MMVLFMPSKIMKEKANSVLCIFQSADPAVMTFLININVNLSMVVISGLFQAEGFRKLFESMVASVLDYGAPVWSHSVSVKAVEKIQQHAYIWFLGVGRKHSLAALAGEMCLMTLLVDINSKQSCFGYH